MTEVTEMVDDDPKEPETIVDEPLEESDSDKYQIAEAVDDAIAAGSDSPFMRSEYYYAYTKGGKLITGLTASMYSNLALVENIIVDPQETRFEIDEQGWMTCDVTVNKWSEDGEKKLNTSQGFGCRFVPIDNPHQRQFVKQTVYSIALRNAIKKLLPYNLVTSALSHFVAQDEQARQLKAHSGQNTKPQQPALPPQPQGRPPESQPPAPEDPTDKARKAAFATFGELEGDLLDIGIDREMFWQAVRKHYNVESRADMDERQWRNVVASLRFNNGQRFAGWIRDLIPKPEPAKTEPDGDKIPF